jgi:hypothetical protein
MVTRTLAIAAAAAILAVTPMLACAANPTQKFNNCVKAFMTDLSKKGPVTLKLRDSRYFGDHSLEVGDLESISAIREFELVANDAHDHHAIARAICAVNAQSDVVELR